MRYRTKGVLVRRSSGNADGLNGLTQHLVEAHALGFQQLRIVRER